MANRQIVQSFVTPMDCVKCSQAVGRHAESGGTDEALRSCTSFWEYQTAPEQQRLPRGYGVVSMKLFWWPWWADLPSPLKSRGIALGERTEDCVKVKMTTYHGEKCLRISIPETSVVRTWSGQEFV